MTGSVLGDAAVALLGAALVLLALVDALTTTVNVGAGGGPLTRRLASGLWRGVLAVHRVTRRDAVLTVSGPLLLISAVLVWVTMLWAGWTLLALVHGGIVSSSTRLPAGVADTVYYTGFSLFTLGVGDVVATTPTGRLLSAVASFTGLFVITLAITYLLAVVAAVVQRRALAVQIHALGETPAQMVTGGWDGTAFSSAFEQRLVDLTPSLATTAEQHLAYPVLRYFRSRVREAAMSVALAHLDDMLLLLEHGVATDAAPSAATVQPTRRAVDRFLETVGGTARLPVRAPHPPPLPDQRTLRDAGVPLSPAGTLEAGADATASRRRDLASMVASDGWSWDVTEPTSGGGS